MQVVLVMFKGDSERRSFSVARDVTVIGRREDCDLRIPLGEVSRKHCRLIKDGQNLRIEDLGSSNGTFRNGERIQEAAVGPGDSIRIGSVAFIVQIDGYPNEDDMTPPAPAATATDANSSQEAEHLETAMAHPTDEFDPMSALNSEDSASDFDLGNLPPGEQSGIGLEDSRPEGST
ncbi:MAG: FHA domain-containing protein [Phycisphaerales bacterium]|jgi:pSer/pThr/pTyr-binding forkhead associated (FHA) protein|nr:FHA domain-containing protein [Phycisphaerales bacterium]